MAKSLAVTLLCALGLAVPAQAARDRTLAPTPKPPQGLHAFLLRASDPESHVFSRTPSFAWNPYPGAKRYEFELSTSRNFAENGVVWNDATLKTPVAAVPLALPWITGNAYSLFAHVRAITNKGPTLWSAPFGFNMRWTSVPTPMLPAAPGLLRWTPVSGATQYNVWLVDAGKVFTTMTNVADEREYYSFHRAPVWTGVVHWRVRPERYLYGSTANGLPAVSYGPWSPIYTSYNPPFATGPLTPLSAISDTVSTAANPQAHRLMPGFTFTGDTGIYPLPGDLFRVYITTDRDCLNIVYRGAIVGSPAYAPRPTGPLALPNDTTSLTAAMGSFLKDAPDEGETYMADGFTYPTSEKRPPSDSQTVVGAKVDLWDTDWPTGRYYATVVPVAIVEEGSAVKYQDLELPQEACAAGNVVEFGKTSEPALTGTADQPYASGLSPTGRLYSGRGLKPKFYGSPLVAWQPALGASQYDVQYSQSPNFADATTLQTFGTSTTLPLKPGTWYYRVRGINFMVPTKQQMTWSDPVSIVVTKPKFRVVR